MNVNDDKVTQPYYIKGYHYSDIYEMFTINNKFLEYNDLEEYYRNNANEYDWREIVDWAHNNSEKVKYKFTKYPENQKIMAVRHESATSILFSEIIMKELTKNKTTFICPLCEDFVLFMHKDKIEDLIEFVKVVKAMNYSMFQKGQTGKYIMDTILTYEPSTQELSIINTQKEFGIKFNIITLNLTAGDINKQIKKEAVNVLLDELKDFNSEDAYELLSNKELYDSVLEQIEKDINKAYNGKNTK